MSKDYIKNGMSQFCHSVSRVVEASPHCKDTVPENWKTNIPRNETARQLFPVPTFMYL